MDHDIFISYSREDKEIILPLIERINREVETECWVDFDGIESGERFEEKIIKAIDSAKIVLFILSDNSLKSDWTKREVYYAEMQKKRIIPVVINGNGLRDWFLFHFQNLDYIDIQSGEQIKKLIRDLKKYLKPEIVEKTGIDDVISNNKLKSNKKLLVTLGVIVVALIFLIVILNKPNTTTTNQLAVFSVSPTEKVVFSSGNLQYQASTNTWRFAEHQWDIIGKDNENISSQYAGWIDLLGWGTGDSPTKNTTQNSDYTSFIEWGDNSIVNGSDYKWRTLTSDEWAYVCDKRKTKSGIRYIMANVNGICGIILFPDNWDKTQYQFDYSRSKDDYHYNSISKYDWVDKIEQFGAVFLPATGYRDGTVVRNQGENGYYWSATGKDKDYSYYVFFGDRTLNSSYSAYGRSDGRGVRLVSDVE